MSSRKPGRSVSTADVHGLLLEAGPLTVGDILSRLPPGWVGAMRRHGKDGERRTIRPGKLRGKLNAPITKGRSLQEMDDGRFNATDCWPGSRTLGEEGGGLTDGNRSPQPTAVANGPDRGRRG